MLHPRPSCFALALLLCALPASAQQTLVVAAAGGTPYQTIQAAIDAAQPNDTIVVRAGSYPAFTCGKAVRIQGEPGVVVQESTTIACSISGIGPGQAMVLSQVALQQLPNSIAEMSLSIQNCGGLVLLDRILPGPSSLEPRLIVSHVAGLLVHDSTVGPLRFTDTTASLTNCSIQSASLDAGAVIDLVRSTLDMTDGILRIRLSLGGAGCRLQDSQMNLRFGQGLTLQTVPMSRPVVEFEIGRDSRVDYHVYAMPANPTVLGGPFHRSGASTSLRVGTAAPGGTLSIDLVNVLSQGSVLLLASAPVSPYAIPGIGGALFVGGPSLLTLGFFGMGSGQANLQIAVPPAPAFQGLPLVAQGVTTGLQTTNAVGFTLR